MFKYFLPALIILFISCSSNEDITQQIIYSDLPNLETELLLEIGESDDFIPGNLRDLVVTSNGTFLVSDWGQVTIEQFSPEGDHISTIAAEGGGPGELTSWFSMLHSGNDTLLVNHQQGAKRDLFTENVSGVYSLSKTVMVDGPTDRPTSIVGHRIGGKFYATTGTVVRDIQQAMRNLQDYRETPLISMNIDGTVVADSLHLLKSPQMHLSQMNGGFTFQSVPYRNNDRFLALSDGEYIIARPDSTNFFHYSADHTLKNRIPFHAAPRPVEKADLDFVLKNVDREIRREIEPRVHDNKPPYLNAWISSGGIWLYTDSSEKGKEFIVLNRDGEPLGRFLLSDFDEIKQITENVIYTIHKDPDFGDSIRSYRVNI